MERIHILFLIDVLYSTYGGAEGVLSKIVRLLPRDRYRCSIATFATRADLVASDRFDCPVHLFPIRRTYDWCAFKTALQLSRLIRSEHVAILHTFFAASDLLGGVVARLSGCPIIVSSRRDMGYQRNVTHRVAYRLGRGLFDQVHAVAENVRLSHIRQDGLDPDKVKTIYNGVDLDDIDHAAVAPRSPELGLEGEGPVVACVANLRPIKGLETLVRTAAIVCRDIPQARFVVAGALNDTDYLRKLTNLAEQIHVTEQIRYIGLRTDVPSILKVCDLFYLPSRSEGLSNALLEAMACGLPCVATDVGGNSELIDEGRSGYLVPADNADSAAERILTLLKNRPLAARMGQAGRKIVESKFTVQAMMIRLTELYDELLGEAGIHAGRPDTQAVCAIR